MSSEELQRIIDKLGNVVNSFSAVLEDIMIGVPKKNAVSSVITKEDKKKDEDSLKENARSLDSAEQSIEKERAKIFAAEFKTAFQGIFPTSAFNSVATEDEAPITPVHIVGIDQQTLDALSDIFKISPSAKADDKEGGGILGGVSKMLGVGSIAGLVAGATGIIGVLRMLATPHVIAGIAVGLGTIIAAVGAFSLSLIMVVKTLSYLKDDIVALLPVFKDFLTILIDGAKSILPTLIDGFTKFAATLFEVYTALIRDLAPVFFDFIRDVIPAIERMTPTFVEMARVVSNAFTTMYSVIGGIVKSIIQLFDNLIGGIVKIAEIIGNVLLSTLDLAKEGFKLFSDALISVANVIDSIAGKFIGLIDGAITRVPEAIKKVFDIITDFAQESKKGVIGTIASEIAELALSIGALTAGSLLNSITNFFSKSPLDKIIEFQNQIDSSKFNAISLFAASLKNLASTNDISLNNIRSEIDRTTIGVETLILSLDRFAERRGKTLDIISSTAATLNNASSALSKTFKVETLPDLNNSVDQYNGSGAADNKQTSAFSDIFVKVSDEMMRMKIKHVEISARANEILKDILQKISTPQILPTGQDIAAEFSIPLQYRSSSILQKLQGIGYE